MSEDVYEFLAVCPACAHSVEFDVREESVGVVRWERCPECDAGERALIGTQRALRNLGVLEEGSA